MEFYKKGVGEVLKKFKTDSEYGITSKEQGIRQQTYGTNELVAKSKINPLVIFINQFRSFIIYILIFAVAISFIAKEYVDAVVILIILVFNAFFGFFQEYKAERAIEALKKLSGLKAKVIRGGVLVEVFSKNLVPGDIILLESGSRIPADSRIIEALGFEVSEASLTGESVPVSKFSKIVSGNVGISGMKNMVFSGTAVTKGHAKAVVVGIGMNTEIGKIAGMVSEPKTELTPLQKDLESLGRGIGIVTIFICLLVFSIGVYREGLVPLLFSGQIFEFVLQSKVWFLTAISLAVAAVPEGLPIVVTIALAIGTRKLLKKNVLIRKLPSVETLGETNIICSDKTGTLTSNQMTVRKVFVNGRIINFSGTGYSLEGVPDKKILKEELILFRAGVLCNESRLENVGGEYKAIGDPTEVAFFVSAFKAGIDYEVLQKTWKTVDEKAFDSVRKLMSTVNIDPKTGQKFVFTKGAPEHVLEKCNRILIDGKALEFTPKMKARILSRNNAFSKEALRVLGFAYRPLSKDLEDFEEDLIFIGLQAMMDPPHKEVAGAIKRCKAAGIRVVMMTGDNINTAKAIGLEIGIVGTAMSGIEFEKLSEKEKLRKRLEN
ncbi:MAG: HAD-IC family P-type ATPase [Nanoarchaeota archaeon]|nr:HAD-IC family P-type ATPase [Nanoarchaeota archaeon]